MAALNLPLSLKVNINPFNNHLSLGHGLEYMNPLTGCPCCHGTCCIFYHFSFRYF